MRQLVMFNRVSADGYFASADGKLDWVVPDDAVDSEGAKGIPQTDTVLFGRRTYEMFASFWPQFVDDPKGASDPHNTGRKSPAMREMAAFLNNAKKVVFSKTLKEAKWKNSEIRKTFDPQEVANMKKESGKDMIIFGSGSIVSLLSQNNLIDEYRFVVCPVFLESGQSLLTGGSKALRLDLEKSKQYPSGNLMLSYVPAKRA